MFVASALGGKDVLPHYCANVAMPRVWLQFAVMGHENRKAGNGQLLSSRLGSASGATVREREASGTAREKHIEMM